MGIKRWGLGLRELDEIGFEITRWRRVDRGVFGHGE